MQSEKALSIERVVILLHPWFAGLATWLVALLANEVPGAPRLSSNDMTAVLISVFLGITAVVWKWLHGRQRMLVPARPAPPR